MLTFQEWVALNEAKVVCNSCGTESNVSNFDWNAGKARCPRCGGSVDKKEAAKKKVPPKDFAGDLLRPGAYSHRGR